MKNAKELYPEYWEYEQKGADFYGPSDYDPIIYEIGNVIIKVDDNDYQGDSRILYEKDTHYIYSIIRQSYCNISCYDLFIIRGFVVINFYNFNFTHFHPLSKRKIKFNYFP
jgi:hypothetical protein